MFVGPQTYDSCIVQTPMLEALSAIRRLAAGTGDEGSVYRAAAEVRHEPSSAEPCVNSSFADFDLALDSEDEICAVLPACADASLVPTHKVCTVDGVEVTELYTWGLNTANQLGYGSAVAEQLVPRLVVVPRKLDIKSVACGRFHNVAVASCGSVLCWGFGGTSGRLGLEGVHAGAVVEPARLPEFGPGLIRAVKAAAGLSHSLVLTTDGTLFAWGSNDHGQLGVQGVKPGEGAHVRRPTQLKALRDEVVKDIAAGAQHSICIVGGPGALFVWGSNQRGALGLGAPPIAPSQVSTPQQLPHVRGAFRVISSSLLHVNVVLTGQGDAVLFGAPGQVAADGRGVTASGRTTAASTPDARFYLPSRVRRRDRSASDPTTTAHEGDGWQKQHRTLAGGFQFRSVALGTEEAFGVDSDGCLWCWPLTGSQRCIAEVATLMPAPQKLASPNLSFCETPTKSACALNVPRSCDAIAVSSSLGAVWIIDTVDARLWQIRRSAGSLYAEPYDHLGPVSFLACGSEHIAATVRYKRPAQTSSIAVAADVGLAATKGNDSCDSESEGHSDEEERRSVIKTRRSVPTLMQLCEERLVQMMSPRSLALVCGLAWHLCRKALLDQAYTFMCANAPLLFSRAYLPTISQLPYEVLAAFELTAEGRFALPSEAFDIVPSEFPPKDMREAAPRPAQGNSPLMHPGEAEAVGSRRRRPRGGGVGAQSPKTSPLKAPCDGQQTKSPQLEPSQEKQATTEKPAATLLGFPGQALCSNETQWTAVAAKSRRAKADVAPQVDSKTSPTLDASSSDKSYLVQQSVSNGSCVAKTAPRQDDGVPSGIAKSADDSSPTTACTLADFLRPRLGSRAKAHARAEEDTSCGAATSANATSRGPSDLLSVALRNARNAGWCGPAETAVAHKETTNMRQILQEAQTSSSSSTQVQRGSKTAEDTHCSWGRDAMPSEQSKGISVYELQRLEKEEQDRRKQEQEINELEEMFAALAVAERAEAKELAGEPVNSEDEKDKVAKSHAAASGSAQPASRGGGDAPSRRGRNRNGVNSNAAGAGGTSGRGHANRDWGQTKWRRNHQQWTQRSWWTSSQESWWHDENSWSAWTANGEAHGGDDGESCSPGEGGVKWVAEAGVPAPSVVAGGE
eukprot:TRINITY_DN34340_c0_g2_i1.p1 TRINITY_DN34340_c0_g2~~TRINITY_DN34340_c0_g2_i1.p1  ORF type:complete len:1135 (+),score=188.53 TRINITY_DN34340_c0_g2_i1:3-3407(+)